MDEVKWIKIYPEMFGKPKIKKIRRLPDGDKILLFWVMLLATAGKCNAGGLIFITERVPYTEEDLAHEFEIEITTIRLALKAFCELDMIAIDDKGFIDVVNWNEYQSADKLAEIREQNRLRQQKKRDKAKQALIGDGRVCEYCGNEGTTVDHIIPTSKGGLDVPENTVCSCLSCNMKKTNRDLVVFLNEMLATSVDFELDRIESNKKIMKYVVFDDSISRFVSRDTSRDVTLRHAIEEDRDGDKEKETHSFIQPGDAEEREASKRRYLGGSLGKGVVLLSEEQIDSLLDELSIEEFNHYVEVIADCELQGKSFKKKTHYQAILDMAIADRKKAN